MLFWRPNVRKQPNMFKRALLATTLGHVFVLCMLFCWYQGSKVYDLTLSKNHQQGTVVFLPYYKRVGAMGVGNGGHGSGKKARVKQAQAKVATPAKSAVKVAPPKVAAVDAVVPDIRTMVQAHDAVVTKFEKKKTKQEKRAEARAKALKEKKCKKEQQKKKKETKKERRKRLAALKFAKQQAEKKKVEPKKVVENNVEPEKKPEPLQEPVVTPEPVVPVEQVVQEPLEFSITGSDGQVTYVGQEEYEVLMVHEHIQQELERCWQPPVGMDGLACTIRVALDWQGNVKSAQVQKASGVLAFDVPARCAAMAMEYPKMTWGKELVLHFKQ